MKESQRHQKLGIPVELSNCSIGGGGGGFVLLFML